MDKSILIRRLSLIKHIFNLGLLESNKPEPLCSTSILLFHDSLELFFHLAVEHINASKSDIKFMKYFEIIENKIGILSFERSQFVVLMRHELHLSIMEH